MCLFLVRKLFCDLFLLLFLRNSKKERVHVMLTNGHLKSTVKLVSKGHSIKNFGLSMPASAGNKRQVACMLRLLSTYLHLLTCYCICIVSAYVCT